MRSKYEFKFDSEWSQLINEAARQCGLTPNDFCRRAVMLTVRNGFESGRQQQRGELDVNRNNATTGVDRTDTTETQNGVRTDTNALSDTTDASTN